MTTEQAKSLKTDGIIDVRFATSQVGSGMAELLAHGTAVKLESESSTKTD